MHDAHEFLKALTLVLGVAALTTVLFQRLGQPVVLGYLIAGLLVGPHVAFPLFADPATIQTLSELGVILLMFALGLEFRLRKLVDLAPTAGLTALIQCSFMLWLGFALGRAFGWTSLESIFTGALLAISSTTIIAKAFDEQRVTGRLREFVVGVLIVEDLIAVLLMAGLTAASTGSALSAGALTLTTGASLRLPARAGGGRAADRPAFRARDPPPGPPRDDPGRLRRPLLRRSPCWRSPSAIRWRWAHSSPARWSPNPGRRTRSSASSSRSRTSSRRSSSSPSAC